MSPSSADPSTPPILPGHEIASCVGYVLAGGKSCRMGRDKALLPFQGKPLLLHAVEMVRLFTPEVYVIASPVKYGFLGVPVIPDAVESAGPISAILTALKTTSHFRNLVLACDMPWIPPGVMELLFDTLADSDAVVPQLDSGKIEPLCALYTTSCLASIEKCYGFGRFRISDFLDGLNVRYLTERHLHSKGWGRGIFRSVNTPSDYAELLGEKTGCAG
jgi:molybdopterin-guanine dinucleotide biosynthesis protein A